MKQLELLRCTSTRKTIHYTIILYLYGTERQIANNYLFILRIL